MLLTLERFLGLDLTYLAKNGFWVLLNQGLTVLSALAISVAFARLASREFYGHYQFSLSVINLFSIFSLTGLNLVAIKAVVEGRDRAIIAATRLSFLASLVAIPGLLLVASFYVSQLQNDLALIFLVAAGLFPAIYATNTWRAYYEGKKDFRGAASRSIVLNITIAGVIIIGLLLESPLVWLVVSFLAAQIVINAVWYFEVARKLTPSEDTLDRRLGYKVTIQRFTLGLTNSLPVLVIQFFYTFEHVAIFSLASYILTSLNSLIVTLLAIYVPQLFALQRLHHSWKKIIGLNLLLGLAVFIVSVIGLQLGFMPIYGEKYYQSYQILQYIIFLSIFFPLHGFLVQYLTARGHNISVIVIQLLSNSLGIAVVFFLTSVVPFPAIAALYYSTLIGLAVLLMLGRIFTRRDLFSLEMSR